jgi:hypothetical protein
LSQEAGIIILLGSVGHDKQAFPHKQSTIRRRHACLRHANELGVSFDGVCQRLGRVVTWRVGRDLIQEREGGVVPTYTTTFQQE